MKAVQISEYGDHTVLTVVSDKPQPEPGEGQVLTEIYAASINPYDELLKRGIYRNMIPVTLPYVPGGDFSGVNTKTGEEIYGTAQALAGGSGAFAEFAAAKMGSIAPKPKNTSFIEAAALPLVGTSAVQALEEHIGLQKGQKILIHGGAGGIGHIAVQLARHIGAYIAATVRADDMEYVKKLGADTVVEYKSEDFSAMLSDYDAVYDTVGGETTTKSFKVLKNGGILVSMKGQPDETLCRQYGVRGIGQNTKNNAEHLTRLTHLVETGAVIVNVDRTFPLENVREAFEYQSSRHPRGKVVLTVKE